MKYIASHYNLVIHENEQSIYLYNTYSGALAKLEKRVYESINSIPFDENGIEFFEKLVSEGFVVPEQLNEFNRILLNSKKDIYGNYSSELSFVIAPTLLCNLQCIYCFEHSSCNDIMNMETGKSIVHYILSTITSDTKKVKISWFGGEPLIAFDVIKNLSKLLKDEFKERNIEYFPSMITNGTLLTEDKCKILVEECGIKKIQITIDGECETYCIMKHATKEQYYRLLENIFVATKYFAVSIRLNATKDNYYELENIAEYLKKNCLNKNNLKTYIAQVVDYSNSMDNKCFSLNEFLTKKIEFDLKDIKTISNGHLDIPKYRKNYCGALRYRNAVIGPKGELYKCEHLIGEEDKIIGDVFNGLYYNDLYLEFLNNDFKPDCRECILFPKCLGGCPIQRKQLKHVESCCITIEYLIACLKNELGIK